MCALTTEMIELHRGKILMDFLPGNSRDDRAHLRTYVPVSGEYRPTRNTLIRHAAIQKYHAILER